MANAGEGFNFSPERLRQMQHDTWITQDAARQAALSSLTPATGLVVEPAGQAGLEVETFTFYDEIVDPSLSILTPPSIPSEIPSESIHVEQDRPESLATDQFFLIRGWVAGQLRSLATDHPEALALLERHVGYNEGALRAGGEGYRDLVFADKITISDGDKENTRDVLAAIDAGVRELFTEHERLPLLGTFPTGNGDFSHYAIYTGLVGYFDRITDVYDQLFARETSNDIKIGSITAHLPFTAPEVDTTHRADLKILQGEYRLDPRAQEALRILSDHINPTELEEYLRTPATEILGQTSVDNLEMQLMAPGDEIPPVDDKTKFSESAVGDITFTYPQENMTVSFPGNPPRPDGDTNFALENAEANLALLVANPSFRDTRQQARDVTMADYDAALEELESDDTPEITEYDRTFADLAGNPIQVAVTEVTDGTSPYRGMFKLEWWREAGQGDSGIMYLDRATAIRHGHISDGASERLLDERPIAQAFIAPSVDEIQQQHVIPPSQQPQIPYNLDELINGISEDTGYIGRLPLGLIDALIRERFHQIQENDDENQVHHPAFIEYRIGPFRRRLEIVGANGEIITSKVAERAQEFLNSRAGRGQRWRLFLNYYRIGEVPVLHI